MSVRRALICAPLMPEYDKESGGQSILDLILFLREAGWAVSFACENPAGGVRYRRLLQQRGVAVYERFGDNLDELIEHGKLDLAIFCFWYIGEQLIRKVRVSSPTTRVVINTMDLHFLRNARRQLGESSGSDGAGLLENGWGSEVARELSVYAAADAMFCVSAKEAAWVGEMLGSTTPAHVVTDYERLSPSPLGIEDRRGVLFVGNFRHPPNAQAVEFLCRSIAPRIPQELRAEHPIYIVGTDLKPDIRRHGVGVSGVKMVGWVPTLLPYYHRVRVAVAPLLHGGGTKRKVLQALTAGVPAVSSTVGVEGFDLEAGRDVLVADEADAFAEQIIRLLTDDRLWRRMAKRGPEAVSRFDREAVRDRYLEVVEAVLAQGPKRIELRPEELSGDGPATYDRLIERVRRVVSAAVPAGAKVAVVSRGDDRLVAFDQAEGYHFPQVDGVYAGHHPSDSAEAIDQLEFLRSRGVGYLLLPRTALWWLDYYDGLRDHLTIRYSTILDQADTCRIFALSENGNPGPAGVSRDEEVVA